MAPKKKMKLELGLEVDCVEKPSEEISCASDASWRKLVEDIVNTYERLILDGNYGNTSIGGPSLYAEDGNVQISGEAHNSANR